MKIYIFKYTDKRSGITYVYRCNSYWDKEKKQPRVKRTLIGKIDPTTGEIVPTSGSQRNRSKPVDSSVTDQNQTDPSDYKHLYEALLADYQKQETTIKELSDTITLLKKANQKHINDKNKVIKLLQTMLD